MQQARRMEGKLPSEQATNGLQLLRAQHIQDVVKFLLNRCRLVRIPSLELRLEDRVSA